MANLYILNMIEGFEKMIIHWTLSVLFLAALAPVNIKSASVLPRPNLLSQPSNTSTTQMGPFFKPIPPKQCVKNKAWVKPQFDTNECRGALQQFYYEEMTTGGLEKLEFIGVDKDPTSHLRKIQTPRKYIFGK